MTDISITAETNLTEAISGTTPTGRELEQTDRDEYIGGVFPHGLTGQEQREAWVPTFRQQTGYLEETREEEHFVSSIARDVSLRSEHREQVISVTQPMLLPAPKVHPKAQRILRVHFTSQILTDLRQIKRYCGKPTSAVYADSLLLTMRAMDEISPFDPFVEVIMAIHDALVYQDNWSKFSPDQYEAAYKLLKSLVQRHHISNDAVEKAIMELEKIGFDTTPFELDIDFGIDNEDKD